MTRFLKPHDHRNDHLPLVRLGQGDGQRDFYPSDFTPVPEGPSLITATDLNLRFLIREPAAVYHAKAVQNLSSHWLAEFRRCPQLYHRKRLGLIPQRDSTAFLVGRAAHTLILEGRDHYEAEYAVGGPVNARTEKPYGANTKAFAEWAERIGKPVLSDDQAALVEQMAGAVSDHFAAQALLDAGQPEGVVRAKLGARMCQIRLDWINPDHSRGKGIVDLKTTENLDNFESDLRTYGYVHQLAFYRAVVERACDVRLPVHIIAVEKRDPYRCGVWHLAPVALDAAQRANQRAMSELLRCERLDLWPTRYELPRSIDAL